jgi:hypothetical protein
MSGEQGAGQGLGAPVDGDLELALIAHQGSMPHTEDAGHPPAPSDHRVAPVA